MAEEKVKEVQSSESGSSALKTMIIVGAVLLIEGATITGTMYFSGGPAQASGAGVSAEQLAADKLVELLVIQHKFDNRMAGRPYLYDTEIYINTRKANEETVKAEIEGSKAAITVDVGAVFRRAEPAVFQEPTYATLSRQIKAVLDKRFGVDEKNEPIVHDVLILKCIGYAAEG